VGVDVDETGGDHLTAGVDLVTRAADDFADLDDPPGRNTDIRLEGLCARSVNHQATPDCQIHCVCHRPPSFAALIPVASTRQGVTAFRTG